MKDRRQHVLDPGGAGYTEIERRPGRVPVLKTNERRRDIETAKRIAREG
jgi:hypothetical protein